MILFESFSEIETILHKYDIKNYTIDNEGLVNVDGDVNLYDKGLTKIPVKFRRVTGEFDCRYNKIKSLEGAPKEVGGDFLCSHNQLISLEGAPPTRWGDFYCRYNNIISFEGFPKHIGGDDFNCFGNPIWDIWILFEDYSKIELLNDYDAIQDGVVILDRLNDFLITIGKEPVKSVSSWKCI